jgi:hypothetical protein
VKRIADGARELKALRDLVDALPPVKPYEGEIVKRLLAGKRFTWYGLKEQAFREEPQDQELVRLFFEKARGLEIKGFKTDNGVKVDV